MALTSPQRDPFAFAAAVAALVFGALLVVSPASFGGALLHAPLCRAADARLDASLARNGASFAALSGLKGGLAVIEGSSVGVGFQLELGDLVQPAYDYLDLVWRAFLAALALLGLFALILETGVLELGLSLLGLGLFLMGAGALARWRGHPDGALGAAARRAGRRLVGLGFALGYGLPLALLVSQLVSAHYLEPLRARSAAQIEAAGAPLEDAGERMRALRERLSILEPGKSLDEISREARAIMQQASEVVWTRARAFSASVLVLGVELLLLPFASAWILLVALRAAARSLAAPSPAVGSQHR